MHVSSLRHTSGMALLALVIAAMAGPRLVAQGGRGQVGQGGRGQGRGGPPPTARAAAPVDLTGYWVSVVTEDWRFRMVTPPKGDTGGSVPLNDEGKRVADTWDPSKEGACEAYGAAGLMRMPGRLHITWQDDSTLKIETDAGQQTRLLHFVRSQPPTGERTLQGYSAAEWGRVAGGGGGGFGGFGGFGGNVAPADAPAGRGAGAAPSAGGGQAPRSTGRGQAAPPTRWAPLKVVTTRLRPAWLRRNGIPYSENTVLTENFIRFSDETDEWFTVVTIVEDPTYLTGSFITSTNFKREPDGAKWKPASCRES